jgi:hypothetical protein
MAAHADKPEYTPESIPQRQQEAAQMETEPAPPVYKRHDPCGQAGSISEFTEEEWKMLPFVGFGPAEDDDKVLEYRNCICGSSIVVEHPRAAVAPFTLPVRTVEVPAVETNLTRLLREE